MRLAPTPVDSIAQLVERRSRNPKMRVRIFLCSLQCQINVNLVFHIFKDSSQTVIFRFWVSRDVVNFTGGQLQIDRQSKLILRLVGNMRSFDLCTTAQYYHQIHFVLTLTLIYCKMLKLNTRIDIREKHYNGKKLGKCKFKPHPLLLFIIKCKVSC